MRIRGNLGVKKRPTVTQWSRPTNKPVPGQSVTVHITGWGKERVHHPFRLFWSTGDPGEIPFTFKMGQGSVIKGWDECVFGMHVEDFTHLRCSPDDVHRAHGLFGYPDWVNQTYSIVEFFIKVLAIEDCDDAPLQSKLTWEKPPHVPPAVYPTVSTKTQTTKVVDQSAAKRKKHNDESEPTPRRSKRQHNPLANVDSTISAKTISKDHQNLDIVGPTTATQEAFLAPHIAPINVAPAIQKNLILASEGVAQDSDPSKSLSHALGLIEVSASRWEPWKRANEGQNVSPAIQKTITLASEGVAQDSDPSKSLSHTLGLTEASASRWEPWKRANEEQNDAPAIQKTITLAFEGVAQDSDPLKSLSHTLGLTEASASRWEPWKRASEEQNVVPAIQKTITLASEGVAQDSDPSKSLSHALGLTESSASRWEPWKRANEEQKSPKHFEMDLLEMGSLDSEDLTLLDIANVQDYSSTIFDDPIRVIDHFLSNVSSSHSQLSAPAATVSEIASSLHAELLSEFRSVAFTDNILETLKQGQDPTIRLQTIKNEIESNKELFTQAQLDEVESTVKFLNEFSSACKRLGALQDSKGSIQQDIASSSRKLQQTGVKLAHAKESKRSHQSELSSVESRIKELEDELRKLNTQKESLQSESSTHDAKIEADMKSIEQLMRLILGDKARLFKAEKETEYAKGVFDEHEKKYQALRNNVVGCTVDGKDLKDQHQEIIDGNTEIFLE